MQATLYSYQNYIFTIRLYTYFFPELCRVLPYSGNTPVLFRIGKALVFGCFCHLRQGIKARSLRTIAAQNTPCYLFVIRASSDGRKGKI